MHYKFNAQIAKNMKLYPGLKKYEAQKVLIISRNEMFRIFSPSSHISTTSYQLGGTSGVSKNIGKASKTLFCNGKVSGHEDCYGTFKKLVRNSEY